MTALIAALTLPALVRLAQVTRRDKPLRPEIYEDKDGVATEESMSRFSTKVYFVFVFLSIAVGLSASFALAVYATARKNASFWDGGLIALWLLFSVWVSIVSACLFV